MAKIGNLMAVMAVAGAFVTGTPAMAQVAGTYTGVDEGSATPVNSATAQSSFLTAAGAYGSVETATFENVAVGDYVNNSFSAGTGLSIEEFGPDDGSPFNGVTNYNWGSALYGFNTTANGSNYLGVAGGATFTFASGTNSVGFFITGIQSNFTPSLTVSFNDGAAESIPVYLTTNGGVEYFGITDASLIYSVTITNSGSNDAWGIDDVSYNLPQTPVPEPGSLTMFGAGLVGLAGLRVRRRS